MKKIETIALVLPSGNIKNLEEMNKKISLLEKNFKIKKYYNENVSKRYLSDSDENKVKYFENALLDEKVDMVLAVRGGYGAIRIVDLINYSKIEKCNKIFLGSSDLTILLCALYKKTNLKLYHSLMISNGFIENLNQNLEIIEKNDFNLNLTPIKKGNANGILWGGNLSSLVSMFSGDNYLPNEDIILFLEDLAEPNYKIDKMLYEIYRNKELKKKIKGIIFGDFYLENDVIEPILKEYSNLFNVPTFKTDLITHKINNMTIPFGKYVEL